MVETQPRLSLPISLYFVYDIEERKYMTQSEYKVTYNQIALQKAIVPQKGSKDDTIRMEEFEYEQYK